MYFTIILREVDYEDNQKKKNRWWNCVQQIVINAQLQIGKRGQKQS